MPFNLFCQFNIFLSGDLPCSEKRSREEGESRITEATDGAVKKKKKKRKKEKEEKINKGGNR